IEKGFKDKKSGADFKAGKQTLNGEQALAFVRRERGRPRDGSRGREVRPLPYIAGVGRRGQSPVPPAGPVTGAGTSRSRPAAFAVPPCRIAAGSHRTRSMRTATPCPA
ncbi:LCP family protein, partial [Streptomyces sp. NPDC089919]|uniref:LCP family glycopolymer transferase n=1 Tax=Streptomyces sp. NPDC089919 TaxID=3155188 RepID=UPI0034320890